VGPVDCSLVRATPGWRGVPFVGGWVGPPSRGAGRAMVARDGWPAASRAVDIFRATVPAPPGRAGRCHHRRAPGIHFLPAAGLAESMVCPAWRGHAAASARGVRFFTE